MKIRLLSCIVLVLTYTSAILCVEEAIDFKLEKIDSKLFEDETVFDDYYKNEIERAQLNLENEKPSWEKDLEELKKEDETKAKDLEDKINDIHLPVNILESIVNLKDIWESLNNQERQTEIDKINRDVVEYNQSVEAIASEIKKIEKELITPELPDDKQPIIPEPGETAEIPTEWTRYQEKTIPAIMEDLHEQYQQDVANISGETLNDFEAFQKALTRVKEVEAMIIANLEAKYPPKSRADYEKHKEILQNIVDQGATIGLLEIKDHINGIDEFLARISQEPVTNLGKELGLKDKIPSDQMKKINEKLINALNEKNIAVLADLAKEMEHYNLNETYSDPYTIIISSKEMYEKEALPPEEPTQEEEQNQGFFQTMFGGFSALTKSVWQTVETIKEGVSEAVDVVSDVTAEFVKFTAAEMTDGLARVTGDTVGAATSLAENIEQHTDDMTFNISIGEKILATYSYLPEVARAKILESLEWVVGETVKKNLTEVFDNLDEPIGSVLSYLTGNRVVWLVGDKIIDMKNYLESIGADKAIIDTVTSVVQYTIKSIVEKPELLDIPKQFLKSVADLGKFTSSMVKWASKQAGRLSEIVQESLSKDLATARNLIKEEKNSIKKTEEARPTGIKATISGWIQGIKDYFSSFFRDAELDLTTAQGNYTKARNDYLTFIGIEDPALATEELIAEKLNNINNATKKGLLDQSFIDQFHKLTDNFLKAQSELADVFANHQKDLNSAIASFEFVIKAWDSVGYPTGEEITSPDYMKQLSFSKEVIKLFEMRNEKLDQLNLVQDCLDAIKTEMPERSAFEIMHKDFVYNTTKMITAERINTINSFNNTIDNLDVEMKNLEDQIIQGLGYTPG